MAQPTIGDAITLARKDLSDSVEPYRWTDADFWLYGSHGQREIMRQKPASQYIGDDINTTDPDDVPDFTVSTARLSISRKFLQALAHWLVYSVLKNDSEDAANQKLAEYHWDKFLKEMA